jgi:MFS superfamily sulfate permease-like transporter
MNSTIIKKTPPDYLIGLKECWKSDVLSGFLVFLIAMPLSLGIAKASDFPPVMGLLTAIIGGIVVSIIAGSKLTIKGPAAGLIVIAAGSVAEFGGGEHGWHLALGAIVVAGTVQILFGVLKLGSLSSFFPTAVIHGMLAAIGLIIFAKQIHTLLGIDPKTLSGLGPLALLAQVPHSIMTANSQIALIGILSLIVVFGLPQINNRFVKRIPSPVIVLLIAMPLAYLFDFKSNGPGFSMVKIGNFIEGFAVNVDFSGWQNTSVFIKYVILFALIGSIESLLTVKAVDGMDPFKRKANANQDLIAVGIGNTIAGIFGGLPMISEVARSSANVNNGAQTRWSNFFHGVFLLLAVIFIPFIIELIPNTALAALLIGVGYRLASPKEFISTYKVGPEQLLIFITTIFFTLADDLLIGVFAGIAMKFLIEIKDGASLKTMFSIATTIEEKEKGKFQVQINSPATFSNLISFKNKFEAIPKSANVTLDFSKSSLADHTFMEMIHQYEEEFHDNGGHLVVSGFDKHHFASKHPHSARVHLNNPAVISIVTKLTKRQQELAEYANTHNLEFEPTITSKIVKLSLAPFPIMRKIRNIENLLVGSREEFNYFYADVFVEDTAMLTKIGKSFTILYISNINKDLPDFTMEQEGLIDILGLGNRKDINFPSHPSFSKRYVLSGEDETAIRTLFTDELLTFLESQGNIFIECVHNSLLIYSNTSLVEPKNLDNFRTQKLDLMNLMLK